jgi:hypothetical protein
MLLRQLNQTAAAIVAQRFTARITEGRHQ